MFLAETPSHTQHNMQHLVWYDTVSVQPRTAGEATEGKGCSGNAVEKQSSSKLLTFRSFPEIKYTDSKTIETKCVLCLPAGLIS